MGSPKHRNPDFVVKRGVVPSDQAVAKEYFEQAIEKEPGYALAYSGLADSYFYRGYWFGRMAPKEAMPKAKAAALKALGT